MTALFDLDIIYKIIDENTDKNEMHVIMEKLIREKHMQKAKNYENHDENAEPNINGTVSHGKL
jgi:hypothetical protein